MTDELKDQRIPIMMTPSEVKAIDDWMFANRIRSRGEAIRRLCKVGLDFDAAFDETRIAIWDLYFNTQAHGNLVQRRNEQDLPERFWKTFAITSVVMFKKRVMKLFSTFGQASGTVRKLREIVDIQEAFNEASRLRGEHVKESAEIESFIDGISDKLSPLSELLLPQEEDFPKIPKALEKLLKERGQDSATAFGIPVRKAG